MKTKMTFVLMFLSSILVIQAQSANPPIQSREVTKVASMSTVARGVIEMQSSDPNGIDYTYSNSVTTVTVTGQGLRKIREQLLATPLKYRLHHTNTELYGYLSFFDSASNLLWFGFTQFSAAQAVPGFVPDYTLWMQALPILTDIASANLFITNSLGQGSVYPYDLEISDGRVLWPPFMSETENATLSTVQKDGALVNYPVMNPVPKVVVPVSQTATVSLENEHIYTYTANSLTLISITVSNRPIIELKVTGGIPVGVGFDIFGVSEVNGQLVTNRPTHIVFVTEGMQPGQGDFTFPLSQTEPTYFPVSSAVNYIIYFLGWPDHFDPRPLLQYGGPSQVGSGDGGAPYAHPGMEAPALPIEHQ